MLHDHPRRSAVSEMHEPAFLVHQLQHGPKITNNILMFDVNLIIQVFLIN